MAGNASADEDSGAIYNINVTPLVDITLVLLIIMMVTAKIIVSQGMPMDLPQSTGSPQPIQMPKFLVVELKADGSTLVDKKPIANDRELIRVARAAKQADPDPRAVIKADERAKHGRVIHVLDTLKQLGISKVAFASPPKG
jgi:biopolymer transport protein ExbD